MFHGFGYYRTVSGINNFGQGKKMLFIFKNINNIFFLSNTRDITY